MRIRTPHNDSIVSEAAWYDTILAIPPLPFVVSAAIGALSPFPISSVVGASGFISAAMLAYGSSVATPKSAAGPTSDSGASVETDVPSDGVTTRVRDDAGRNRRHGSV